MHCHFTVSYGRACTQKGTKEFGDLTLCWQHERQLIAAVGCRLVAEHNGKVGSLRREVEDTLDQITRIEQWERDAARVKNSMIYFVERDAWIKIGFTTRLAKRLAELPKACRRPAGMTIGPVTLLAVMSGSTDTEYRLHGKFAAHRVPGTEWFHPSDDLRQFIAQQSDQQS
jgi:hypothetical protein